MFQMRPDFLVEENRPLVVLDAKWKRIDARRRADHYDLHQSDFYQLHAYGKTYLGGNGTMAILCPRWTNLPDPLPEFRFDGALALRVLPVDLEQDRILGLESLLATAAVATAAA